MSDQKSLLSLVAEATSIEEMLIESGGEMTPEIEQRLAVTEIGLPEKVDNYALTIERFESISAFYKQRAEMFSKMSRSASAVVERCKSNLKTAMTEMGSTEILGFDVKFKLSPSNPAVVLEDGAELDGAYVITETTTYPDKKKIAEDLKLGVPVRGARLEQSFSLRKYASGPDKKVKQVKA